MDIEAMTALFPDKSDCIKFLELLRWQGRPICPYCSRRFSSPLPSENRHHCNPCNAAFSVTVGTMFHKTRVPLQMWFCAIYLIARAPRKIPVRVLAQKLQINKNTAARIASQVRRAWAEPTQRVILNRIVCLPDGIKGD
jgi:transposase-like protein